jgi:hypothetical protein
MGALAVADDLEMRALRFRGFVQSPRSRHRYADYSPVDQMGNKFVIGNPELR